ncbi:peptidoglycan-binding domain-containing protein [Streptomyces sp. NBC_01727]|uniref:peptidoglycan-binding domain-containing protein n=1 Tax=Streptomyces sp. NBC_01727 TaxID=2975924 RepID=UPI002E1419DD|nr:peptidoglycan-binding protein [Streptomyces sp. NBC_01727]
MRKPVNALLATLIALGGSGLSTLTSATPAAAATPTCNWSASYYGAWVPNYGGPSSVNVNCALTLGNYNNVAVGTLQETLNHCYGEHLVVDQDFGTATDAALRRAQAKAGTTADGDYGPATRKAIKHKPTSGTTCVRVP